MATTRALPVSDFPILTKAVVETQLFDDLSRRLYGPSLLVLGAFSLVGFADIRSRGAGKDGHLHPPPDFAASSPARKRRIWFALPGARYAPGWNALGQQASDIGGGPLGVELLCHGRVFSDTLLFVHVRGRALCSDGRMRTPWSLCR